MKITESPAGKYTAYEFDLMDVYMKYPSLKQKFGTYDEFTSEILNSCGTRNFDIYRKGVFKGRLEVSFLSPIIDKLASVSDADSFYEQYTRPIISGRLKQRFINFVTNPVTIFVSLILFYIIFINL